MGAPILALDSVEIRHADSEAVTPAGVTMTVETGEVVLLLGPSGCGKSTTALAINGLVPQSIPAEVAGSIALDDIDVSRAATARLSEHVAMVFQDPDAQIVTGSVFDEVCFALENLLLPIPEIVARAEDALRVAGLWQRREDSPDILSGGARQRLAIASALAMRTPLLVLDEPTANLDPRGRADVYAVLRRIVETGEHSVVLIEHNVDAALSIVDRVVVCDRDGRTVFAGTPRDVLVDHAREVASLGVWLPAAPIVTSRLAEVGIALEPAPLTVPELTAALNSVTLPALAPMPAEAPAAVGEPLMSVRDLTVERGGSILLDRVSLDVHGGEFLALVGANGAGKTTLVQAMTGVSRPPKGSVTIAGMDAATRDTRALARRVGFVFQNPEHQFIANTVADELAAGLRVHGDASGRRPSDAEITDRVDAMLARLGLSEHRDAHPFLLSGGQKRRLSVGTALIVGAPILALDEPTFGQDRERADELMSMLDDLRDTGTTIVIVSHDMQLVAEHASRVVVVSHGTIAADGSPSTILTDRALVERNALRQPPLAAAMSAVADPAWRAITRFAELPRGER